MKVPGVLNAIPPRVRDYLGCLLGWDSRTAIDRACESIDLTMTRYVQLTIVGDGDLIPLAQQLHARALGEVPPFIVCDPRRNASRGNARSAANAVRVSDAIDRATGGTLCLRARRLPSDFDRTIALLRGADVRLFMLHTCWDRRQIRPSPIEIPPLEVRRDEIPRIVEFFLNEGRRTLKLGRSWRDLLDERELAWLSAQTSLAEIAKACLRLLAVRISSGVRVAAKRLGIAPVSLTRWLERRDVPLRFDPDGRLPTPAPTRRAEPRALVAAAPPPPVAPVELPPVVPPPATPPQSPNARALLSLEDAVELEPIDHKGPRPRTDRRAPKQPNNYGVPEGKP